MLTKISVFLVTKQNTYLDILGFLQDDNLHIRAWKISVFIQFFFLLLQNWGNLVFLGIIEKECFNCFLIDKIFHRSYLVEIWFHGSFTILKKHCYFEIMLKDYPKLAKHLTLLSCNRSICWGSVKGTSRFMFNLKKK